MTAPTIAKVKKTKGVAGQYAVTALVTYPGEKPDLIQFVGNTAGGPIVMVLPSGLQTFVSESVKARCGYTLSETWVEKFFAEDAWQQ